MSTLLTSYVGFVDGVKEIQPTEDQISDKAVTSMMRVTCLIFEKGCRATPPTPWPK